MLLWVGAAEAAFGIICFLSNRAFNTTLGVSAEQYGFMPGTHGTQYEANLFGSYTACCAVMFLAFFLLSHEPRAKFGWGLCITLIGALISLARSVLFALPVATVFVVWVTLKTGHLRIRRLLPLGVGVVLVLLAISPLLLNFVSERIGTIDLSQPSADDTFARIQLLGPEQLVSSFCLIGMIICRGWEQTRTRADGSAIRPFAFFMIRELWAWRFLPCSSGPSHRRLERRCE